MSLLDIQNLHVKSDQKDILKGLTLTIHPGEVHAVMGPNGAGKSTLGNTLAGKPGYDVTEGSVQLEGQNLLEMAPEARASAGLFLGFQYPVEIPGVGSMNFLRTALNAQRRARAEEEVDSASFLKLVREKAAVLSMGDDMLKRAINSGFSGGEKKRMEILQLLLFSPKIAVLDETDSGLDIDALKTVSAGINSARDGKRSFLLITHYQRLLDYIVPDHVHVLADGHIVRSGGAELAKELEAKGYAGIAA